MVIYTKHFVGKNSAEKMSYRLKKEEDIFRSSSYLIAKNCWFVYLSMQTVVSASFRQDIAADTLKVWKC